MLKFKRPFSTHYFGGGATLVSQGACASEEGAIRSSVPRLFLGQYDKAHIVDRASGVVMYTVTRVGHGIRISYGSGIDFKRWSKPDPAPASTLRLVPFNFA